MKANQTSYVAKKKVHLQIPMHPSSKQRIRSSGNTKKVESMAGHWTQQHRHSGQEQSLPQPHYSPQPHRYMYSIISQDARISPKQMQ